MWAKDKSGNWVNLDQLFALVVATDPNNDSYYVVLGQNIVSATVTTLWDGHNMTQAEAVALLDRLVDVVESFDPTA